MSLSSALTISNQHVQRLRRLVGRRSSRHDEGVYVVDGPTLVAEAVSAGLEVECQFVSPGSDPVSGAGIVHHVADGVLEKVADTESPRGVMAIARRPVVDVDVLTRASFVVVAHGLSDPGNLGTLMRSAEAAGADAIAITPGSVDATSPKVVRSSAGAVFHLPVVEIESLEDLRHAGLTVIGTSSHHGVEFARLDLTKRIAITIGHEAHGLPEDASVDQWTTIPHAGRAESLNAAMAGTILCFEVARQRRGDSGTVIVGHAH